MYAKRLIRRLTFSHCAESDVDVNKIHLPELEHLEGIGRVSTLHHLARNAPKLSLLKWRCTDSPNSGAALLTQVDIYTELARLCPLLATLHMDNGRESPSEAPVDSSPLQRWTHLSDFTTCRLLTPDYFLSLSAARPPLKRLTLYATEDSPMDAINVLIETTASTLGTHPRGGIGVRCAHAQ